MKKEKDKPKGSESLEGVILALFDGIVHGIDPDDKGHGKFVTAKE